MRVALLTHPSAMDHDSGWGHPERPARIPAVVAGVNESGLTVIERDPVRATTEMLSIVHERSYVDAIERFCAAGGGALDADTHVGERSWEAALRAAGAGATAVQMLDGGDADTAFIAMRPPGHHALAARAMGFCLFNNIAVTAGELVEAGRRVAIVDWDVHHGNGTQQMFFADPDVLYVSWHEHPWYPGTGGEPGATGVGGTTINFPFPMGTGGGPYRWSMGTVVAPVLDQFAPDWVLVSAGYDAHRADPLAGIRLDADDYAALASAVAAAVPSAGIIFYLEGGYDLEALRTSVAATLAGTARPAPSTTTATGTGPDWEVAQRAAFIAARHWDL